MTEPNAAALVAGGPDDFPCLATIAICPCNCGSAGDVVIRCGNCGTEAHAEEWSIPELVAYVEQHCAGGDDHV